MQQELQLGQELGLGLELELQSCGRDWNWGYSRDWDQGYGGDGNWAAIKTGWGAAAETETGSGAAAGKKFNLWTGRFSGTWACNWFFTGVKAKGVCTASGLGVWQLWGSDGLVWGLLGLVEGSQKTALTETELLTLVAHITVVHVFFYCFLLVYLFLYTPWAARGVVDVLYK